MTLGTIKMTASQFLQMGKDPPGVRLELANGEISASPTPNLKQSFLDVNLSRILSVFIQKHNLGALFGDVGIIFGKFDVRRSDLIYFSKSRLHLIGEKAMEGPPDLCVEIISPSSGVIDRKQKFKQYEKDKVPLTTGSSIRIPKRSKGTNWSAVNIARQARERTTTS